MYSVSDSRCKQSTARLGNQQEASFLYQILPAREAEYLDVLRSWIRLFNFVGLAN